MSRYGASTFSSLLNSCVLWAPLQHSAGVSGDIDEFPILPSGVTVTNNGTFTKTDLGNNKSVLNFDGSTNYISLTDTDAWNLFEVDFTICFWIKYTAFSSYMPVLSQRLDANNLWYIERTQSTQLLQLFGYTSSVVRFNKYFTHSISADVWSHVVFQRSGDNCFVYVNGISQTVTNPTGWSSSAVDISAPLRIGNENAIYYNGNIKDLLIYKNRALTQAEIKLIMNRTNPNPANGYGSGAGMIPGPYSYWRLTA